jgi:hypothetical protein
MWNTCGSFWKCISNVTFRLQRTLKNRQLLLKKVKIVTLTHEVRYVDNMVPNWDSNILAAKDTRMKQVVSRETKNVKSEKIHVQCTWIIAKVLHQDSNILAAKDTRMKQVVSRETKNVKSEKIHVQCTWITAKVLHQDSNILGCPLQLLKSWLIFGLLQQEPLANGQHLVIVKHAFSIDRNWANSLEGQMKCICIVPSTKVDAKFQTTVVGLWLQWGADNHHFRSYVVSRTKVNAKFKATTVGL